jgi:uncharacterized protein
VTSPGTPAGGAALPSPSASLPGPRLVTLDVVRGLAVLGILLMNIIGMGLPAYAYVDPTYYGLEGPADLAAWAITYVLIDGKMRALFTMLFGASMVLIADRALARGEEPAEVHYRRMFWLLIFGLGHAWLLWYGDILVQYAVGGALAFFLWRWQSRALLAFAIGMLALQAGLTASSYPELAQERQEIAAEYAIPPAQLDWREIAADSGYWTAEAADDQVAAYRGSFRDVFAERATMTIAFETSILLDNLPEILAFIAFGILFYRNGFLAGRWRPSSCRLVLLAGFLVAAPLTAALALFLLRHDFDPMVMPLAESASLLLRLPIALAFAALAILLAAAKPHAWLVTRLAAAGRMAFSNYLLSSLIATTLFYGYGGGLFGQLSRAEHYLVVAGIWALILLGSKPWLDRYRYGPLEWLWRTLARGERQPMRLARD